MTATVRYVVDLGSTGITGMDRPVSMRRRATASGGWVGVCAALWVVSQAALAQAPQPPAVPPAPQQAQPQPGPQSQDAAPAPKREGVFDAFGRWFDKSARDFKANVDEANAKWRQSVEESNARWRQSIEDTNAKLKAGVDENNARWREFGQRSERAAKDAAAAQKEAAEEFRKAQKEAADAFKNLANTRLVEGRQVCETAPNGSPDCHAAAEIICKGKGFTTGKSADIQTARKCSARALLQRDESECRTESVVIKAACQ